MRLTKEIKRSILLFFSLQLILILAFYFSQILPSQTNFFLGRNFKELVDKPILWTRANFDGFHYLKIARDGYGYLQEAFFPLYPFLIKFLQPTLGSYLVAGLLIVNLAFITMILGFYSLLKSYNFDLKNIGRILLVLVFFPTSFYFLALYNEAIFLTLIFFSFYQAKKGQWLWAGILAGLSSATRVVGIFMFPALLVELWQQNNWRIKALVSRKNWPRILAISTSSFGLLFYMIYLRVNTGDWFRFATVQSGFGAQRVTNRLIVLPQVFWRYLKMIITVDPNQYLYFNVWLEVISAGVFLLLLCLGWYHRKKYRIPESWLTFASFAYLLPTLTGTFSSLPRYVLVCFPAFIVLERLLTAKGSFLVYFVFSLIGLVVLAAFFFRGYWVA